MKRIMALCLSFVLIVSTVIPISASAESVNTTGQSGTTTESDVAVSGSNSFGNP